MFFTRFQALCQEKGISVYRACTDIGLNRSAVAKWKAGGKPNGTTAGKLADYFGVSTDCWGRPRKNPRISPFPPMRISNLPCLGETATSPTPCMPR